MLYVPQAPLPDELLAAVETLVDAMEAVGPPTTEADRNLVQTHVDEAWWQCARAANRVGEHALSRVADIANWLGEVEDCLADEDDR